MVFQIVQESPWHNIFGWGGLFLIAMIMIVAIFGKWPLKITVWIMSSLFALAVASLVGMFVVDGQRDAENNASFSQQLMDEYHVTSSRDLSGIRRDFYRFDEARTVFTQDGKETPVFIKLLRKNDKMIIMDFTVIDDKALYPKPSK
jgi:hypothetical protein